MGWIILLFLWFCWVVNSGEGALWWTGGIILLIVILLHLRKRERLRSCFRREAEAPD